MVDYFTNPTYILFDLSDHVKELINGIRKQFDPMRSALEAEISITGSSGVGTLVPGQSPQRVFDEVHRIADMFNAFECSFQGIGSFPGTGIFFFTVSDERVFKRIHKLFCDADIYYHLSAYAYKPHCTLTLYDEPVPKTMEEKIMCLPVPHDPFLIDNISVYDLSDNGLTPRLLYRVELKH